MYNKCIKAHYVSLIHVNNISHKLDYTKFSIIITPKSKILEGERMRCLKQIINLFTVHNPDYAHIYNADSHCKDDSDATRSKSNVTQHHTQSNEDKTTDTAKTQQDDKRNTSLQRNKIKR